MGIGGGFRGKERWIFRKDAVSPIVETKPELVLALLLPTEGSLTAVEFDLKIVLVAWEHLAHAQRATWAIIEAQENICEIFTMMATGMRLPLLDLPKASDEWPEK